MDRLYCVVYPVCQPPFERRLPIVTPEQRLQGLETWADTVMSAIRALHEDNQAAHKDILDRLENNQAAQKDMLNLIAWPHL